MFFRLGQSPLPQAIWFSLLVNLGLLIFQPALVRAHDEQHSLSFITAEQSALHRSPLVQTQQWSQIQLAARRTAWAGALLDGMAKRPLSVSQLLTTTATATETASATPTLTLTITGTPLPTGTAATPEPTASPTATPTTIDSAALTATQTPTAVSTPALTATTASATAAPPTGAPPTGAPTWISSPAIRLFTSTPNTIQPGESAVLTWQLVNAETAVLQSGQAETTVAVDGSQVVTPSQTTVYTLVVRNPGGEATTQVTITVAPPLFTPTQPVAPPQVVSPLLAYGQETATLTPTLAVQIVVPTSPLITPTATLAPLRFDLTPPTPPRAPLPAQGEVGGSIPFSPLLLFSAITVTLLASFGVVSLALLIGVLWRHI